MSQLGATRPVRTEKRRSSAREHDRAVLTAWLAACEQPWQNSIEWAEEFWDEV
ncbi:hypothetical protein HRbin30_00423 [bacterium HR30]|nr:hypothetical protein HRbin30_00423 [bacterium HR30]